MRYVVIFKPSNDLGIGITDKKGTRNLTEEEIEGIVEMLNSGGQVQPPVSLQNAGWQLIEKIKHPEYSGRYLVAYRYKGSLEIRIFIADYDINDGWLSLLNNIELIA